MTELQKRTVFDDRSALAALKFTEATAAELLGKTRQAVNIGLRNVAQPAETGPSKAYFKVQEWLYLIAHYRVKTGAPVPNEVLSYIRRIDPANAEILLSTLGFSSSAETKLGSANVIVAVIPDVNHFATYGGAAVDTLFKALAQNTKFVLYTTDTIQESIFDELYTRMSRTAPDPSRPPPIVHKVHDGALSGWLNLIFVDPDDADMRRTGFIVAKGGRLEELEPHEVNHLVAKLRQDLRYKLPFYEGPPAEAA